MGLYQNRIAVKAGTSTLTNEMGKSDLRTFDRLACVLSDIQNMGYEVIFSIKQLGPKISLQMALKLTYHQYYLNLHIFSFHAET